MERPVYKAAPLIRVLIYVGREAIINSDHYVIRCSTIKELGKGKVFVSLSNENLLINGVPFDINSRVEIAPLDYFELNGKRFKGNLMLYVTNGNIHFVNIIDVENYLSGVLPSEIYANWHPETIKAQAVVARTYALYELAFSRDKGKMFDVYSDTRSQVYKGVEGEDEKVNSLINETVGEVLKYKGRIIPAFFHSSSGGMTESSMDYFGVNRPYLIPVPSKYYSAYPDYKWRYSMNKEDFRKKLGLIGEINTIKVIERTSSKRIKKIMVIMETQATNIIEGKTLREKIGEKNIKSLRANIILTNDTVIIEGYGYGHGVGFAQWDAQGMATEGWDYRSILKFFFPGCSIDRIW